MKRSPLRPVGLYVFSLGIFLLILSIPAPAAPRPTLSSLSPSSAMAGSSGLTLTVSGSGFNGKCVVLWNGQALPTTMVSSSSVTAAVPAADLASAGSESITVQNSRTGGTSNSLSFTVTAMTVTVAVSPQTVSLAGGASQQFTASVTGTTNTGVTWTTSGGAINSSGLYLAPTTAGTYTVTATSAADSTKSASATVTVSPSSTSVSVSISPISASLLTGGTQQFTASVSGTTNTGVTWAASGGTITTGGLYAAPSTAGTYTVTATSVADSTKKASASVTVSAPLAHSVQLSWTASTSSGVVGYGIYRSTVSGSGYALLNSQLDASLSYTDTAVQSGQTYYYVVTAVTSTGAQSSDSAQVTAVIPSP